MGAEPEKEVQRKSEEEERGQWGNQIEFLLACVGYAVGLGNVWRFPYLCFKNGGGAFLIPYVISLFVAGLPIFYLELSLGQFSSLGPNCIFGKIAPIATGIGWGMVVVSGLVALYYNMIIAWVLFYFFASFRSTLQWASCRFPGFGYTETCYSNLDTEWCQKELNDSAAQYFKFECFSGANATLLDIHGQRKNMTLSSPAEEYFENYVLNLSEGFHDMGPVQWKLALALLGAWIIVFLCLIKGVQSTGKVVYFTATFPYVVLVILLIRGCTLEGADKGIAFYMNANFTKLHEITVWKDAAVQIFYSLGPAFGGLLTMASYNKFSNNCFRDALIVAFTNCATSVFAGFAIFSVAGFMATILEKEVKDVVRDGAGLAFIAYPEAIVRMPGAPFWSILFFFMLLTLGLDSQFAMLETVTTALMDQFTWLRKYKMFVVGGACFLMFLLGLPLCTRGGMYVFTLINDYSAGYCLVLLALSEVVTVFYFYGVNNFVEDLELMLGAPKSTLGKVLGPSGWYWRVMWLVFTPLFLFVILVFSFVFYANSAYGEYQFPSEAAGIGWLLSILSIIMIPIFAVIACCNNRRYGGHIRDLIRPTSEWCPAHVREANAAQEYSMSQAQLKQPSAPYGLANAAFATDSSASLAKPAKA